MNNKICEYGCGQIGRFTLKNGKTCCSRSVNSCKTMKSKNRLHGIENYKNNSNFNQVGVKLECQFCGKIVAKVRLKPHQRVCLSNPSNIRNCLNCKQDFARLYSDDFCSTGCSTSYRNKQNIGPLNPNWTGEIYRSVCFAYHKKECVVCGESNIVAVHHMDENHNNNEPINLIPLCPTHHVYWHSSYKYLIEDKVSSYVEKFKSSYRNVAQPG